MLKKRVLMFFPFMLMIVVFESTAIEPPPERDIFTAAIIGDMTGGYGEGLEYLERAVYEINQLNPDFVIHVGDMVQGYTRDQDQWLDEYEGFMELMNNLSVPWYPVPGNHDVFTPIWDPNDRTYEELYKGHFGPLRYSFDYKNSHFVVMYTDEAMTSRPVISREQIEWLRGDLQSTSKTNIFIFMHKPAWRFPASNWGEVQQIIKEFPVRAVIAGHFHTYQKDENIDGIQYYVMGPTGAESHGCTEEFYGYFHHYNILRVEGDQFTMAVVKLGNVESDNHVLTENAARMYDIITISSEKTGVRGWLWQPVETPVEGELEVFVHNPLDVDMTVTVSLAYDGFLWSMEPSVAGFVLPAGEDKTARIILSSPGANPEDITPPELEIEYTYTDTYGRRIPLIVRRRVFLRDTREVAECTEPISLDGVNAEPFWQNALPFYNHTWIYNPYERPDAPPKMLLAADDSNLYFYVEVMDDKYSHLKENRSRGLLSDAIIFSTQPESGRREIAIFPFNEEGNAFIGAVNESGGLTPSELSPMPGVEYYTRTDQQAGYYYCEGKVPLSALFDNEPVAGRELPFNATVLDNDREAFVYVRSWAYDRYPEYWGILKFAER